MGVLWDPDPMIPIFFDLARRDFEVVYADALMSGTYEELPRCPKCRQAARRRVPPLVIEWDYGSNVIGDFTWPAGLEEVVVTDRVRDCIESNGFSGVRFESVEMVQRRGLKKPPKESKARSRVWLPYERPPLWNLVVTAWCHLDVAASARSIVQECDGCDRTRMIVHDPEAPLVIKPDTWQGTDFFCIRVLGNLAFVCEGVKQAFDKNGFTNLDMKKRGFIPETGSQSVTSAPGRRP